jgi:hypothetical protein
MKLALFSIFCLLLVACGTEPNNNSTAGGGPNPGPGPGPTQTQSPSLEELTIILDD